MFDFSSLEELRVRFGGIGGQGAVLLGDVLGNAGALAGLDSACSTIYGSRARGGASQSDVILAKQPIDFPHVVHPHLLVAMAEEPYHINVGSLIDPAIVLYDEYHVQDPDIRAKPHHYSVPATRTVLDKLGASQPANFCMLGALVGLTDAVETKAVEEAMTKHVRQRFVEMNRQAFELGVPHGKKIGQES
jgi:2-oxoglutarate ferredoxin oxidoreductase subunit gamma